MKITLEIKKKLIWLPQNPVAQILGRLDELAASKVSNVNLSCSNSACHKFQHFDGPVMPGLGECHYYKQYVSTMFLSINVGNNFVWVDDCACVVKNICFSSSTTFLVLTKFQVVESFSLYPFDLSLIGMCKVSGLFNELFVKPVSAIKCKCVVLSHGTDCNSFVVVPLLH